MREFYGLIRQVTAPIFQGVPISCTRCSREAEWTLVFEDGHIEPRCSEHSKDAAMPEKS